MTPGTNRRRHDIEDNVADSNVKEPGFSVRHNVADSNVEEPGFSVRHSVKGVDPALTCNVLALRERLFLARKRSPRSSASHRPLQRQRGAMHRSPWIPMQEPNYARCCIASSEGLWFWKQRRGPASQSLIPPTLSPWRARHGCRYPVVAACAGASHYATKSVRNLRGCGAVAVGGPVLELRALLFQFAKDLGAPERVG